MNDAKADYVKRLLALYLGLAETPARASRIDRRLAEELFEKQIAFEEIEAALYLAVGRRLMREEGAPALGPIRSLHYFLPVLEEIKQMPLSAEYRNYLRSKVEKLQGRC